MISPEAETSTKQNETLSSGGNSSLYRAGWLDIWALGITIVIGGQYFAWNAGLSAGFGSFALCLLFIGTAYICLILSTSEITSGLPFAGGAYGLARCSLGFYVGYLIGCCEALEYIIYVSISVISFGQMICQLCSFSSTYLPLIWFLFYVVALFIQISGGKVFWYSSFVLALVSLLIVLIFCFGNLGSVNFDVYTPLHEHGSINTYNNMFHGGMFEWMNVLPLAAW